ncbi:MAG: hypothetical protein ACREJ0_02085 [Geminicoccaceae bacterium]
MALIGKWTVAWLLALVLPERSWDWVGDRVVGLGAWLAPGPITRAEADMGRHLARQKLGASVATLARRFVRNFRSDQLAVMRCYTPRPWRPELEVTGLDHVRAARAAGRGCLLWVAPTVFGSLMSKRTLFEAGVEQHHLSREGHGVASRSRLARLLALPRVRLEDRYLAERILIPDSGAPREAMRRLSDLLWAGEVVTILVGANAARTHVVPFLDGTLEASLGVPELARRCDAVLLPVATVRIGPGRFHTTIGPPLALDPSVDPETVGRRAVAELAYCLAPRALASPDQICWHFDLFRDAHRAD